MMKRSFSETSGQRASAFKLDVKIKQKLLENSDQGNHTKDEHMKVHVSISGVETKLCLSLEQAAKEDYIVRVEIVPELLEEDQVVTAKASATAKPEEPVERLRKLWQEICINKKILFI